MKRSTIAKIVAVLIPALAITSTAEAGGRGIGIGLGIGIMTGLMLNEAANARRRDAQRERYYMRQQMRAERARQIERTRAERVRQKRQDAERNRVLAARKSNASKHTAVAERDPKPEASNVVTSSVTPTTVSDASSPKQTEASTGKVGQRGQQNCSRYVPQSGITVDVPCEE